MEFTFCDHVADVAVGADGGSLGAVSTAVTDGLTVAICGDSAEMDDRFSFTVRAEGREALLFDYLDQPICEHDVHGVPPTAYEATARLEDDEWVVEASTHGTPSADTDARDVKAVTYSEMRLAGTDAGRETYVIFDM